MDEQEAAEAEPGKKLKYEKYLMVCLHFCLNGDLKCGISVALNKIPVLVGHIVGHIVVV